MSDNSKVVDDIKKIVGDGERIKMFIGIGEEGADKNGIREFHVTPVAIKHLPKLSEAINRFQKMASSMDGELKIAEKDVNDMTLIAALSLERAERDVTEEQIQSWFGLGALVKIANLALSINDMLGDTKVDPEMLAQVATKKLIAQKTS